MQFIKTRNVKSPVRDIKENAGIDFYIPENCETFRQALCDKNSSLRILVESSTHPTAKDYIKENLSYMEYFFFFIHITTHIAIIISIFI